MAPSKNSTTKDKDKGKYKGKGKVSASKDDDNNNDNKAGSSKLKAATAINTRHILVRKTYILCTSALLLQLYSRARQSRARHL